MDLGLAGCKAIVCASSRGLGRTCATSVRDRHASDGLSQFLGLGLPSVRISRKYGDDSPADMKRSISLIRALAD